MFRRIYVCAGLSLTSLVGCGAPEDGAYEGEISFAELEEAINLGTVAKPWANGSTEPAWSKAVVKVAGVCTGTVVSPSWVLTARHCHIPVGAAVTSTRNGSTVTRTVDSVVPHTDPSTDFVMLHLSQTMPDMPVVPIGLKDSDDLVSKTARIYGYGAKSFYGSCTTNANCNTGDWCQWGVCMVPSADLRRADLTLEKFPHPHFIQAFPNALGQIGLPGDSGGPAAVDGAVVGVSSFGGVTMDAYATTSMAWEFVLSPSRNHFVTGDFNGDGKQDQIIINSSGSYWYFSTGRGTWTEKHRRTDLPLDQVKYAVGDFNGDGKDDMIVSTRTSASWHQSNGDGSWAVVRTEVDSSIEAANFIPGDFDGDVPTITFGRTQRTARCSYRAADSVPPCQPGSSVRHTSWLPTSTVTAKTTRSSLPQPNRSCATALLPPGGG